MRNMEKTINRSMAMVTSLAITYSLKCGRLNIMTKDFPLRSP